MMALRQKSATGFGTSAARPGAVGWDVLVFTLLFWLSTYLIFSVRGKLLPEAWPLLSEKRLLATMFGALLYGCMLHGLNRSGARSFKEQAVFVALSAVPILALLMGFRLAFDAAIGRPGIEIYKNGNWLIAWSGYFFAGTGAFLTWRHQAQSGDSPAPPPAEPAPPEPAAALAEDSLWAQRHRQIVRIPIATLEWAEAEGNYVRLHAADGGGIIRMPLSMLETKLDAEAFLRVHRSALCRIDAIRALRRKSSGALLAVLASGAEVPVGRSVGKQVAEIVKRQRAPDSDGES